VESVDEDLWIASARRGDVDALEHLFRTYQPSVLRLCQRLLGAEDAEDATQATFVQVFRGLRTFRGESSMKTWIYRIALNEAMAHSRRKRPVIALDESILPAVDGISEAAHRWSVQQALFKLKPEHRAILILRFWEELAYEEIAEVLRISLPATKMRLSRAREEFKKCYDQCR
jgi:RNA polymerase sigma-70 factor (ECF subfamily)